MGFLADGVATRLAMTWMQASASVRVGLAAKGCHGCVRNGLSDGGRPHCFRMPCPDFGHMGLRRRHTGFVTGDGREQHGREIDEHGLGCLDVL